MIKYKSIWISDIHLGSKACSAEELLTFLRITDSENLFLVGDIVDLWQLSRKIYWPKSHNEVVQKILRKSRKGTVINFIIGNHDETLRDFLPNSIGDITLYNEFEYTSVKGYKCLITHGDLYDLITTYHKWIAKLGDWGYVTLIEINRYFNWLRRKLGFGYWSLSRYVKTKVKNAASFISDFESNLALEAKRRGYDMIIAGHIHHAEIKRIGDVIYSNDGDFCESCTAFVEDFNGNFFLLEMRDGKLIETCSLVDNTITHYVSGPPNTN
jgi:UDP-2,3-diacylglucosamine pyrophosphatase LpxH